jgi:histone acetyltransferase (RNA polymerase elongator complex component)
LKTHANIAIFIPHKGCPHTCTFCDQRAISGRQEAPTPQEVAQILDRALKQMGQRASQGEIAFFGGSFTAIDSEYRRALLQVVQPYRPHFGGIRLSTRPDAINGEILAELREFGVTAIELGAQSMDDQVLALAQRGHTALDVERAAHLIKAAGFSLGLQMMTGLPGDSKEGSLKTARRLAALGPDTMRIYPALTLEGTELARLYREGKYRPPTLEETVELCAHLLLYFEEQNILVIRLGLHHEAGLRERLVAGPYHPALRELCEGKILLDAAMKQLANQKAAPGAITLYVAPGSQSKMAGQNRRNLRYLEALGYRCAIRTDALLQPLQLRVEC